MKGRVKVKNPEREPERTRTFYPHVFDPKIILARMPRVIITRLAYRKMWHLTDIARNEVSWLGTVREQGDNFLIEDVYLVPQTTNSIRTMMTEDGISALGMELLAKPNGEDLYNRLRFWGHSHPGMSTEPSPQDEEQMKLFEDSEHPFFIRCIVNKEGRMGFTVFLYARGIILEDVEWEVFDPDDEELRESLTKEFKEKVEGIPTRIVKYSHERLPLPY